MKSEVRNVIGYCRVSTDEQKDNTSLDFQERSIREYCEKHDLNLIQVYKDDYSGKGYDVDRPEFKRMYDYSKKYKNEVFGIVFLRWDRFTRNTEFLLRMRRELYENMDIQLICIENPIDLEDDAAALMLGINGGTAEKERRTIVRRTTQGILENKRLGKCTNRAPRGYINKQNGKHDKWVEIDKSNDLYERIRQAFYAVAEGNEAITTVRKRLCPEINENTFYDILKNPFYGGKIAIYEREKCPERKKKSKRGKLCELVQGVHEALVPWSIYEKVQEAFKEGKKNQKPRVDKTSTQELYLRKFLTCPCCGHGLTGGFSKGYNGTRYPYYQCCENYSHTGSLKAQEVNDTFAQYVSSFVPNEQIIRLYDMVIADIYKEQNSGTKKKIDTLQSEIDTKREKMYKLMDKYLEGDISKEEKIMYEQRLNKEISTLTQQIENLKAFTQENYNKKMGFSLNLMKDIGGYISQSPVNVRVKVISSIFPEKVQFDGKKYRTTSVNSVFRLICKQTNELRTPIGMKKEETSQFPLLSSGTQD